MNSFLHEVVHDILLNGESEVKNYKFILPSQRACVFLKNEFKNQLTTTDFLPQTISIKDFIEEISQIVQLESIDIVFEFYSIYKDNTNKNYQDSFERFTQWARIVIQDFNEIDKNLINPKDIFTYLKDINRLKNWNPTTKLSSQYFHFLDKLYLYYIELNKSLIIQNKGYQGALYKKALQNLDSYIEKNDKKIIFAGFNALNKVEEKIVQTLLDNNIAKVYWDVDSSYLNGKNNSGIFLNKYFNQWNYYKKNKFNWVKDYLSNNNKKKIQIIGANKNISQIKHVGNLLNDFDTYSNTAIIHADESLLNVTLNSLPSIVTKVNITMGYPLSNVPITYFFKTLFRLYQNVEKLKVISFYYKDVLNLIETPYFKKLSGINIDNFRLLISQKNRLFLTVEQINSLIKIDSTLLNVFFCETIDIKKILKNFIEICELLLDKVNKLEKEYINEYYQIFQKLNILNEKYNHIKNIKILYQFFNQIVKNKKLSFSGEPLDGLQIMGMLETRAIDFETIIITSVNEGILPSSISEQSFIPYDVKYHFELPTYQEKDAIFSYHFFRLLHRAKNIYLLYNSESDMFGKGEMSRFIKQLNLHRDDLIYKTAIPEVKINKSELIEINKTPSLNSELKIVAQKGISPSAITSFINNPIDFYYQKILKINPEIEVEETIAVNTMGTVIHEVLELLYKPTINQVLTQENIKSFIKITNKLVKQSFQKHYKNRELNSGMDKLIFEVTKNYIHRFLKYELQEVKKGKQIKIIALERKLEGYLSIKNIDYPIKIHGIIDRIDQVDGVIRIIDYKTGKVEQNQLNINDFNKLKDDYKYSKALQILIYAFLAREEKLIDNEQFEVGIISFKNLNSGFLKLHLIEDKIKNCNITNDTINNFIVTLKTILSQMLDPKLSFKENINKTY